MATIERPGIATKWAKGWKTRYRLGLEWATDVGVSDGSALEHYIQHGTLPMHHKYPKRFDPVNPPVHYWESYLEHTLGRYGLMCLFEFEAQVKNGGGVELGLAQRAFAAGYTYEMLQLYYHAMNPKRYMGRQMQSMRLNSILFTALGIIIGNQPEAFQLSRLQLIAYHEQWYKGMEYYPIFHFMFRILADHLGVASISLKHEALNEPIFNALFDLWRHPNVDVLAPVALAACDMHTWRTLPNGANNSNEFHSGDCAYTPIEILLLFKLRQLNNLPNPQLDHPLMNTALGVLPEEVPFQPDDLIQRVRARLQADGYNEAEIVAEVFALGTKKTTTAASDSTRSAPSIPSAAAAPSKGINFSDLNLKTLVSPGFGLVFKVPESWQETSTKNNFQVLDPESQASFTASAYENNGITLAEWTNARLMTVKQGMPYLTQVRAPYEMQAVVQKGAGWKAAPWMKAKPKNTAWKGMAAEYQGVFPSGKSKSHYLVLCLCSDTFLISVTITADVNAFQKHKALFYWLLENQLDVYKVVKV